MLFDSLCTYLACSTLGYFYSLYACDGMPEYAEVLAAWLLLMYFYKQALLNGWSLRVCALLADATEIEDSRRINIHVHQINCRTTYKRGTKGVQTRLFPPELAHGKHSGSCDSVLEGMALTGIQRGSRTVILLLSQFCLQVSASHYLFYLSLLIVTRLSCRSSY